MVFDSHVEERFKFGFFEGLFRGLIERGVKIYNTTQLAP